MQGEQLNEAYLNELPKRRARDSNPQPASRHLISNQTPHHSDTLRVPLSRDSVLNQGASADIFDGTGLRCMGVGCDSSVIVVSVTIGAIGTVTPSAQRRHRHSDVVIVASSLSRHSRRGVFVAAFSFTQLRTICG